MKINLLGINVAISFFFGQLNYCDAKPIKNEGYESLLYARMIISTSKGPSMYYISMFMKF